MKYNIIKLVRNTSDGYQAVISATFDSFDSAKVNYHQTLTTLHNADDVKIATVKIIDEFGHELSGFSETVDHTQTEEVSE